MSLWDFFFLKVLFPFIKLQLYPSPVTTTDLSWENKPVWRRSPHLLRVPSQRQAKTFYETFSGSTYCSCAEQQKPHKAVINSQSSAYVTRHSVDWKDVQVCSRRLLVFTRQIHKHTWIINTPISPNIPSEFESKMLLTNKEKLNRF